MTRKRRASEQYATRQGEEGETQDEQGMPRERQLRTYVRTYLAGGNRLVPWNSTERPPPRPPLPSSSSDP